MSVKFYKISKNPYEPYRKKIESIKREKVFDKWFDETDRDYFFLDNADGERDGIEDDVFDFFDDAGFIIVDYKKGLAKSKKGNRLLKMGKLFSKIKKNKEKKVKERYDRGEIYSFKRELKIISEYVDSIEALFQNSPSRVSGNKFVVVISQKAEDIAKMSTDRGWTSCMELGEGQNYTQVFCEVEKGGLIAYLIRAEDNDIKKPIARILIRRFMNKDGLNIAIPEETTYPEDFPGFREAVAKWLMQRQDIPIDAYRLVGGSYSDTFSDMYFHFPEDLKIEDLLKLVNTKDNDPRFIEKSWIVDYNEEVVPAIISDQYTYTHSDDDYEEHTIEDFLEENSGLKFNSEHEAFTKASSLNREYYGHFSDAGENLENLYFDEYDSEELEKFMEEFSDSYVDPFHYYEVTKDHSLTVREMSALKIMSKPKGLISESIIQEILERDWSYGIGKRLIEKALLQYPHLVTKQMVIAYRIKYKDVKGTKDEEDFKKLVISNVQTFSKEPKRVVGKCDPSDSYYQCVQKITDFKDNVLDPLLDLYSTIPEPVIRDLVNISRGIGEIPELSKDIDDSKPSIKSRLDGHIAHLFAMKHCDTPTVQSYVKELLLDYKKNDSLYKTLLFLMRNMGRNSMIFIDFINERIEEMESTYGKYDLNPDSPLPKIGSGLDEIVQARRYYEKLLDVRFSAMYPNKRSPYNFFSM